MMKFVFVLCVAVALMHEANAFKVIQVYKGAPAGPAPAATATATAPAAPAIDPSALIQGVQSAIANKLQQVQALVGSLVQQKVALKQNALNSIQSTLGSVKSQAAAIRPPFVIRKTIYVGAAKPAAAPAPAPESTTSADAYATTTTS